MRVVTEDQVQRYVTIDAIIPAVESALKALDNGESALFSVVRGAGSHPAHSIGVKSGRDGSTGALGVKVGAGNPANRARGLPSHTSITLLLDDTTSAPRGVVQADYLNGFRTAAVDALAVRALARPEASVLGVIGAGNQAVFEIEAIRTVRNLSRVVVAARSNVSGLAFAAQVRARTGIIIELASLEDTVRQAEILVTATPSRAELFEETWVRPGTHISAMGADRAGKMELPIALVARARLFVDDAEQAAEIGEAQHAVRAGHLSVDGLRSRTLGALLNQRIKGRQDPQEITIFDSSGLAVQDIAAAQAALDLVSQATEDGRLTPSAWHRAAALPTRCRPQPPAGPDSPDLEECLSMSAPHLSKWIDAGGLVFISGQLAYDEARQFVGDTIAEQATKALENLDRVLRAAGLSRSAVVKTTVWLRDSADFRGFDDAYAQFFGEHRPARSTVVSRLVAPEALLEIEAVAVRA